MYKNNIRAFYYKCDRSQYFLFYIGSYLLTQSKFVWEDKRLRFQQLQDNTFQNIVNESLVWCPTFELSRRAKFRDRLAYYQQENAIRALYAKRTGIIRYIDYESYEGMLFYQFT